MMHFAQKAYKIVVVVCTIGFLIIAHELGHAFAAKEHGVGIQHIMIGLPVYPVVEFESQYFDAPVTLSPWLAMGYVELEADKASLMQVASFVVAMDIAAAGIWVTIVLALLVLVLQWMVFGLRDQTKRQRIYNWILGLLTVGIVFERTWMSVYVFPLMSMVCAAVVSRELFGKKDNSTMGPVAISKVIASSTGSLKKYLNVVIGLSIGFTIMNSLPLAFFDGGVFVYGVLPSQYLRFYSIASFAVLLFGYWYTQLYRPITHTNRS